MGIERLIRGRIRYITPADYNALAGDLEQLTRRLPERESSTALSYLTILQREEWKHSHALGKIVLELPADVYATVRAAEAFVEKYDMQRSEKSKRGRFFGLSTT